MATIRFVRVALGSLQLMSNLTSILFKRRVLMSTYNYVSNYCALKWIRNALGSALTCFRQNSGLKISPEVVDNDRTKESHYIR